MQRRRFTFFGFFFFGFLLVLTLAAGGCEMATTATAVPQGWTLQWKLLPHRLSFYELALLPKEGGKWKASFQNNGGSFGTFGKEDYRARLDYAWLASPDITVQTGSKEVEIPAGKDSQSAEVRLSLEGEGEPVVFLRGFRLSTNEYKEPPSWDKTYDPAQGFTSQGLGITLGEARREGKEVVFSLTATHRPAPCDRFDGSSRDDMNGAIPQAKSWMTVFYTVLLLRQGQVTRKSIQYFLNYPDFAKDGTHMAEAPPEKRKLTLEGKKELKVGLVALASFDLLSNDPQQKDASCTIKKIDKCKGPGRYIRSFWSRLKQLNYDPNTGKAQVDANLYLSNDAPDGTKGFETGNMCVRAKAEVLLLQLSRGEVISGRVFEKGGLKGGSRLEEELPSLCKDLPAAKECNSQTKP